MKTTLIIPDGLYRKVKQHAAARRRTVSEVVADMLQAGLGEGGGHTAALAPLPSFDCGPALVDIADRQALARVMEADSHRGF